MTEIIEDVLFEDIIQKNVDSIEESFIRVYELLSMFGELKEIERKIYTSPKGEIILSSLELKKYFDSISFLNLYVEIMSEENLIKIYIKSSLNSFLEQNEQLFNEFYIKEYYPKFLEKAKKITKDIIEKVNLL